MIPKSTLKEWRKQALIEQQSLDGWRNRIEVTSYRHEMCNRILCLTQELLNKNEYKLIGVSTGRITNVHRT